MMEGDEIDSTSEGSTNYHEKMKDEQMVVPSDVDLQVTAPAPEIAAPEPEEEHDDPILPMSITEEDNARNGDALIDEQQMEPNTDQVKTFAGSLDLTPMGGSIDDEENYPPAPLTNLDASRDTSVDEESLQSLDVSQSQSHSSLGTNNAEGYNKPSVAALPSKKLNKSSSGGEWTLSTEERKAAHDKLQQKETKRRQCYEPRLKTSSAYWICVRELLKTSLEETYRATSAIKSIMSTNNLYCDKISNARPVNDTSPQSIVKDGLEALNPLTASGRQNKAKSESEIDKCIHKACTQMAELFTHESTTMHDMILLPLSELINKMESETQRMQRLGDRIHEELHENEESVQHHWSLYYEAYYKSCSAAKESESSTGRITPAFIYSANGMSMTNDDVWIHEAQYCLSVHAQAESWKKINPELTKLFSSIKGLEVYRRSTLKELTTAFFQQQNNLFHGLQKVIVSNKDDLSKWATDYSTVDAEIKESVHSKARLLSATENPGVATTVASQVNINETPANNISLRDAHTPAQVDNKNVPLESSDGSFASLETLETLDAAEENGGKENLKSEENNDTSKSPLLSALMRDARVVERQTTSTIKRIGRGHWKLSLAVVTADAYLHLIDIPPDKAKDLRRSTDRDKETQYDKAAATNRFLPGTSAEVVLESIIVPVTVPTEMESVVSQQGQHRQSVTAHSQSGRSRLLSSFGARNNRPLPFVVPALSVHLARCTVIFDQKKTDNDLVEIVENPAAKSPPRLMLRKARDQKMQIRAGSRSEALELLYHMDEAQVKYVENSGH